PGGPGGGSDAAGMGTLGQIGQDTQPTRAGDLDRLGQRGATDVGDQPKPGTNAGRMGGTDLPPSVAGGTVFPLAQMHSALPAFPGGVAARRGHPALPGLDWGSVAPVAFGPAALPADVGGLAILFSGPLHPKGFGGSPSPGKRTHRRQSGKKILDP